MKIAILLLSLILIQSAVSQEVTRQQCIDSGIDERSVPETIPVVDPDTDGPCTLNSCCTSQYVDVLKTDIQVDVFRECVRYSFDDVIDIAEDFFDDFADSFGDAARDAISSSYSARAGVSNDTTEAYVDNELTYSSQLLANITFERIRGDENDKVKFQKALQEYACDYLASLVQKNSYPNSSRDGRLDGSCICRLQIRDGSTVESVLETIIASTIERFSSTIDNIANLVRAVTAIRDASLRNLRLARDFNISTICTRQFISAIACQHCQGDVTRTCPSSCRVVSLLCLQPLRDAFTEPYGFFIESVRLALNSISGVNTDSDGRFDLHDIQEITGALNKQLNMIEESVAAALKAAIASASGEAIEDSDCFFTREQDIRDGTFECQDSDNRDDTKPDCTREEGDREIVDVDERPDSDAETSDSEDGEGRDRREDDDYDNTSEEDYFVSDVKRLLARFNLYGNFDKIFAKINTCICRAQTRGDSSESDSRDSAGEDRSDTLFVAPSDVDCFNKYSGDLTSDELDRNPAYTALTADERSQVREQGEQLVARFTDLERIVAEDPDTSATFEQLMGGTSDAGRLLTSLLLVLSTAFLTVLFVFA